MEGEGCNGNGMDGHGAGLMWNLGALPAFTDGWCLQLYTDPLKHFEMFFTKNAHNRGYYYGEAFLLGKE
jgi:hypothetical protein